MKNALKITLIAAPILIGAAIIFQQAKAAARAKKLPPPSDPPAGNTQSVTQVTQQVQSSGASFPLRKGSVNKAVGQLQAALGFTGKDVDNKFGTMTEGALKAATGKTEVKDANELAQIIVQLQNKVTTDAATKARQDRAALIWNDFKNLKAVANWYLVNASTFTGVVLNYGAYTPTGRNMKWNKGQKLNTDDYQLVDTTKMGFLIIKVTKGSAAGLYSVNPIDVLIQK